MGLLKIRLRVNVKEFAVDLISITLSRYLDSGIFNSIVCCV